MNYFSSASSIFHKFQQSYKSYRNKDNTRNVEIWQEIISGWTEQDIGSNKVRSLCASGIPTNLRGEIWNLLIGNQIYISQEIYDDYISKAQLIINDQDDGLNYDDNLEEDRRKSIKIIERDIDRTFPSLAFFHGGDDQLSLTRILKAYAICRPDVGYIQGMSYIVGKRQLLIII